MDKPRVLIIENSLDFTGGLNSALRSCELLKNEFDFCFLLPNGSRSGRYVTDLGYLLYELPMKEIRKDILHLLIYFPFLIGNTVRLTTLLKKAQIDLIVSNDFYNLLPSLYRFFGGGVPYICFVRFLPSKFPQLLVRCWCWFHNLYASAIVAVSEVVKKELPNKNRVVVISNEIPHKPVDYVEATSETILYPANYISGKGHEAALQAFVPIHHKYPQWKLRFVGGDIGLQKNKLYKEKLIELSVQLGLKNGVEWNGFSAQIDQEYLNAAIVLNFSESESFSMTCLEAMFYGRVVVATRSGGPQEIIEHEKNGLLVNIGDVQSMTSAIEELVSKPDKRSTISLSAYQHVRARFDLKEIKKQLTKVYYGALGGGTFRNSDL